MKGESCCLIGWIDSWAGAEIGLMPNHNENLTGLPFVTPVSVGASEHHGHRARHWGCQKSVKNIMGDVMTAMPTLGSLSAGRDNNLNLMRLVAASMVLVSHSYPLATGNPASEPWLHKIPLSPGALAVDLFFIVSGFLVAASLLKSQDAWSFVVARALRIYPGLWVALLITVVIAGGGGVNVLSLSEYFSDPQVLRYLWRNGLMILGGEGRLPGAFALNPYADAVNGSLWTLRYELRMYALMVMMWVALGWVAGRQSRKKWFERGLSLACLVLMTGATVLVRDAESAPFVRLGAMFFAGAAAFVWRQHIRMHSSWVAVLLLGLVAGAWVSETVFTVVYRLSLPYLVLYVAFVPGGVIRQANRVPDCSYGVYIYAFFVQQVVVALCPGISVWELTAISGPVTLVIATLSWYRVEKPSLELREKLTQWVMGWKAHTRKTLRSTLKVG